MQTTVYWELNPAHITSRDARLLEEDPRNAIVAVVAHERGWLLRVPRWAMEDRLFALSRSSFSVAFSNIIEKADQLEADWINLTTDAAIIEELTVFEDEGGMQEEFIF